MPSLTVASGMQGSAYYALGKALAEQAHERWQIPAEVFESKDESIENLRMVAERRAQLGLATVDVCNAAIAGAELFSGVLPVVALARLYEDYLQVIVQADSPFHKLADLKAAKAIGVTSPSTFTVAIRAFAAANTRIEDSVFKQMSVGDAVEKLRVDHIQALIMLGALETPALTKLDGRVRVISLPDEVAEMRDRFGSLYQSRAMPALTYGIPEEVITVGLANLLMVHREISDQTAYRLTELLFAAKPRMIAAHREALRIDTRSATASFGVPIHAGALRYYRESKPFIDKR